MAEAMGLYQFGPSGPGASRSSTRTAARSPSARTRRARWPWPAPTRRWRPSGTQCDVVPVTAVLDRLGEPLTDERRRSRWCSGDQCTPEAIPSGVANTLNQMLRKDVEPGNPGQTAPARLRARATRSPARPAPTQDNVSVAFVGYTPEIAASVMVFNPKVNRERRRLRRRQGRHHLAGRDGADPGGAGERGVPAGRPEGRRRQHQAGAGLLLGGRVPQRPHRGRLPDGTARVDSDKPDGALVGTSPPRGGRAVPGQLVTILISNGSDYVEPTPEPVPVPDPVPTPEPPVEPPESPGEPDLPDMPAGGPRPPGLPDGFPWPPGG